MPHETGEAIDKDGWFHTGDVGLWTPEGRLKVIDRTKHIFKLAQGEYVAPEKLENLNVQSKFVLQNFVHGDSLKRQLVTIVVIDPDAAVAWAKEHGVPKGLPELCRDETFKRVVLADLQALGATSKLAGFEIVQAVHLEPTQWSPGEVLTPTFKLRRKGARDRYGPQIDSMYAALEAATSKL